MNDELTLNPPLAGINRFEYRSDAPIGDGGFAHVYSALDRSSGTEVALKILKPDHEDNKRVIESFFRDPGIAMQLDHPNIVKIISVGDLGTRPYFFAMEYCGLGDLRRRIQKARRLAMAKALRHSMAICDALRYCHQADIFHRDIKASNILFRNSETPVLSDFGNAGEVRLKIESEESGNAGSPPYMSPEVWQGEDYSARSDLYSFGILLYYILTSTLPFSGQTPEEFRKMHLNSIPSPPSKWRASVSRDLDEVVLSLLEKRPRDRISSAAEVLANLTKIHQQSYEGIDMTADADVRIFFDRSSRNGISVSEFPFRIGKGEHEGPGRKNHLVVGSDDPYVSRCHAIVERFEEGFYFIDVSTNGSFVNGRRLHKQSVELCRENTVMIGRETTMVIRITGRKKSDDDAATTFFDKLELSKSRITPKIQAGMFVGAGIVVLWYVLKLIS